MQPYQSQDEVDKTLTIPACCLGPHMHYLRLRSRDTRGLWHWRLLVRASYSVVCME